MKKLAVLLAAGFQLLPIAAAQFDSGWTNVSQKALDLLKHARISEAEQTLTDSITAARKRNEISIGLAEALSDLGALYHDAARLIESERVYKESISLWEKIPGTHPNHGVTLGNFAALRLAQGRPSDALKLYRRAEQVLVSSYGAGSPRLYWVSCGLADVYWTIGRYEDARQTIERILPVLESPAYDMELASVLFLRAKIAWEENQHAEAERLIRRANGLWERSPAPLPSVYASGLTSLAVLVSKKDPSEAERLFRRSLEVLEEKFGPDHAYAGFTLVQYAMHLKTMGRKKEANNLKRRGEEIIARHASENLLSHTFDINASARRGRDKDDPITENNLADPSHATTTTFYKVVR